MSFFGIALLFQTYIGQSQQAFLEEAKDLLLRGIPLDGIGVQGHFTGHVNPTLLQYRLKMLSDIKIPLWLTEVDVLEQDLVKRADNLETVMRSAFSTPSVQGLILWSFWNYSSWRGPYTSLVDGNDWEINSAGLRYRSLLKQWTTHVTLTPSFVIQSDAYFDVRGFYGDYDVILQLPNGINSTHSFTLDPGNGPLNIEINLPGSPTVTENSQFAAPKRPKIPPLKAKTPKVLLGEMQQDAEDDGQDTDNEFPESDEMNQTGFSDSFTSSSGTFVGCYDNTNPLRQLKYRYEGHPAMTPDICVDHCASKSFSFAGLLMASECFCGAYFNDDSKVKDEECKLPCQGDRQRSCGGQKYIAIYSTA
ncbi:uncharacterized protein LOC110064540 [Orbicella faveolata]|uniref:uncharacterized protein LOC110064540 n=1 Tax=Orbicella faveolata TaxID=48498 RepID=UPI0009E4FD44|nr:uncharacterized protein LOC110064540 [Orbicella faveolata]